MLPSGSSLTRTRARTAHHLATFLLLLLLPAFALGGILDPAHAKRAAVDGTYQIEGSKDGNTYVQVYGDSDPALVYSDGWNVRASESLNLTDGEVHVTYLPASTLSFSFRGTALALIGTTGPNHGAFSVRLNSTLHKNLSSHSESAATGQALFAAQGLPHGETHALELTHEDKKGVELAVDAVVVWGDAGTIPSPTPVAATTITCVGGVPTARHRRPGHAGAQDKHFPISFPDSGGIGFPFSCPTAEPTGGGGGGIVGGGGGDSSPTPSLKTGIASPTPSLSTTLPNPDGVGKANHTNMTGTLIGGVLGGLAGASALVALVLVSYRRHKDGKPLLGFIETAVRGWGRTASDGDSSISSAAGSSPGRASPVVGRPVMVEPFPNGAFASAFVAGGRNVPPRTFDVDRPPVRTMAPSMNLGLSPYFSPASPGAVGRPTHQQQLSSATNASSGTSYSAPNDIKHIALAGPIGQATPSSENHGTGSSSGHGHGSSSGHGHGNPRRSTSRTLDPYLNRRTSVLSVRNPDPDASEDEAEEMASAAGPMPRTPVRISEGYLYDPSVRESIVSQPTRSMGHSHSNSGSSSQPSDNWLLAAPSPHAPQFRSPHAVAFQPELVVNPPPPMSAVASVFGPPARRQISTLYEEEFYHSGHSSTQTAQARESLPARESYPRESYPARESHPVATRQSFSAIAARPSVDGDNIDPGIRRASPSPFDSPQVDSDRASLQPPRRYRKSLDNATYVGTPSSVQFVQFGADGYFGSPIEPGNRNSGSSSAS